jgi:hypothetical protein
MFRPENNSTNFESIGAHVQIGEGTPAELNITLGRIAEVDDSVVITNAYRQTTFQGFNSGIVYVNEKNSMDVHVDGHDAIIAADEVAPILREKAPEATAIIGVYKAIVYHQAKDPEIAECITTSIPEFTGEGAQDTARMLNDFDELYEHADKKDSLPRFALEEAVFKWGNHFAFPLITKGLELGSKQKLVIPGYVPKIGNQSTKISPEKPQIDQRRAIIQSLRACLSFGSRQ